MKRTNIFQIGLCFFIVALIALSTGCRKDEPITDASAKLTFSNDTVLFDTVFTTIGSTTRLFKVLNTYNKAIIISSIRLGGGTNSQYRINVDGIPCTETHNVEIKAKDSMFVFVKVTVNPTNINSPLVVSDSILFETNGNQQKVMLIAWGQDAYYYYPDHFYPNFPPFSIISCNSTWTNDKPHVIYGYAVVDSACVLNIEAGARIYLHNNSVLWIYKDGTLHINGTSANPVTIQGDRLEQYYKDVPGQWGEIWLSPGSKDNTIDYAIIKNGIIGLQVDTCANSNPTLKINNTIIKNMSNVGIYARGAKIVSTNCVVARCGAHAIALTIGGNYNFRHCTIGNYWTYANRQTASLLLNNYYKDINEIYHIRNLDNAYFGNCIIYGNADNEITLNQYLYGGTFKYTFDHCLLKTTLNTSDALYYINCKINNDPLFVDATLNDYRLVVGSPVIDVGNAAISNASPQILFDITGNNSRIIGSAPDFGAYEKKP